MARLSTTIKKLQSAINKRAGAKLLLNTNQWYSKDRDRPVTVFTIRQVIPDLDGNKNKSVELFKTYSQVQLTLWLRDYWYELNGWEIPTDNPIWEEVKKSDTSYNKRDGE